MRVCHKITKDMAAAAHHQAQKGSHQRNANAVIDTMLLAETQCDSMVQVHVHSVW